MDTNKVDNQWQMLMGMAASMKREGIDTEDLVPKLREARTLINHVVYDEHAHGEELLEAELAVDEAQRLIISILKKAGREEDFHLKEFKATPGKRGQLSSPPPKGLEKNEKWLRIRLIGSLETKPFENLEGIRVISVDDEHITLAGSGEALQRAVKEISSVFPK